MSVCFCLCVSVSVFLSVPVSVSVYLRVSVPVCLSLFASVGERERKRALENEFLPSSPRPSYVHVMEGVSASRVAIDIMTDLALGRGTQIPKDVGLLDDRFQAHERLTIVSPLREFSNKEIVVFNRYDLLIIRLAFDMQAHTGTRTHAYT